MYPILLQIGPLTLYSLWTFLAIGIFTSLLIVNKLVKSRLVKLSFLADNSLLIFLTSLIVSRFTFIIYNLDYFWHQIIEQKQLLEIFYVWDKGLSAWGAIIGIALSLFLLARQQDEDFWAWSDIVSVSILIGMFWANIGAFLDGRNYGIPSNLPWAISIESSQFAVPIHPVQIYAALYSLGIGYALFQHFNHPMLKKPGIISLTAFTAYCLFRFLEEFLRGDESHLIFNWMREAQLYSLIGLLFGGYMMYKYFRLYQKTPFPHEQSNQ